MKAAKYKCLRLKKGEEWYSRLVNRVHHMLPPDSYRNKAAEKQRHLIFRILELADQAQWEESTDNLEIRI